METRPLFQLCGEVSGDNEKYFLFPKVFNYWFYKSWCYNMGGTMVVPSTDEEYHSDMDIAESMVDPQTHEKVYSNNFHIAQNLSSNRSASTPLGL